MCNGSTTDSGSVCLGSNPSGATQKERIAIGLFSLLFRIICTRFVFLVFLPSICKIFTLFNTNNAMSYSSKIRMGLKEIT